MALLFPSLFHNLSTASFQALSLGDGNKPSNDISECVDDHRNSNTTNGSGSSSLRCSFLDNVFQDDVNESSDDDIDEDQTIQEEDDVQSISCQTKNKVGRPKGSTNRKYERNLERIQSLRKLPSRNFMLANVLPTNYSEAIESDQSQFWQEAMEHEFNQLNKFCTWKIVERPADSDVVSVKWVYSMKSDGRYKARLVARGFEQKSDDLDVYSPVIRMDSIRIFFSLAASNQMDLVQFDCSNAFLNGDIDGTVYIEQPPGFDDGTNRVCLLQKGLYGLRQSPKSWNKKFDEVIRSIGFNPTILDPCLYHKRDGEEFTILCLYVDDALLASNVPGKVDFYLDLIKKSFEIRVDTSGKYIGMEYFYEKKSKTVKLFQTQYLKEKLELFGMSDCKPALTPIARGTDPYSESSSDVDYPYRQAIGALLYLSCRTRPDISYSVSLLSRFIEKPTLIHVKMVKHLWRYLKGTIDYGITLGGDVSKITAFSDSDLAGEIQCKSTTGWLVLFNGPIIWKTKLQKCVIDNTSEAEFIAASLASKDVIFLKNFLLELGVETRLPELFCDNQSAVKQMVSPRVSPRLRHIRIRLLMVRDLVAENRLRVDWIRSSGQLADIFTKPLPKELHQNILRSIMQIK